MFFDTHLESKNAKAQIRDKNKGSRIAANGIKYKKIFDLIRKACPIQYSPNKNQPNAKAQERKNISFRLLNL